MKKVFESELLRDIARLIVPAISAILLFSNSNKRFLLMICAAVILGIFVKIFVKRTITEGELKRNKIIYLLSIAFIMLSARPFCERLLASPRLSSLIYSATLKDTTAILLYIVLCALSAVLLCDVIECSGKLFLYVIKIIRKKIQI